MDEKIDEKAVEIAAQTVTEVSKKPIELLGDIIFHWLKRRFKETINKNILEDAEDEAIQNEIQKRCKELAEKIPTDQLITPDKQITTAALDSMLFCSDNVSMRDMFINIMLSTMDNTKRKYAHPSFPHILKQLSPLDARVFSLIEVNKTYVITSIPDANCLKLDDHRYVRMDNVKDFPQNEDTPLSFTVLSMLGLIAISDESTITNTYMNNGELSAIMTPIKAKVKLTRLGSLFHKCCINDEI